VKGKANEKKVRDNGEEGGGGKRRRGYRKGYGREEEGGRGKGMMG